MNIDKKLFKEFLKPPFERSLNNLINDDWKNVRSIVTTTFTSGKLKEVFKFIQIKTSKVF